MIAYRAGNDFDLDAVIEANLVITAWDGPVLVGISRSPTGFPINAGESAASSSA